MRRETTIASVSSEPASQRTAVVKQLEEHKPSCANGSAERRAMSCTAETALALAAESQRRQRQSVSDRPFHRFWQPFPGLGARRAQGLNMRYRTGKNLPATIVTGVLFGYEDHHVS